MCAFVRFAWGQAEVHGGRGALQFWSGREEYFFGRGCRVTTGVRGFSASYVGATTAVAVVTVLLAGCGGGSSSSPAVSPPPPPSGGTTLNGNGGLWAGTVSAPGTSYDGDNIVGVYTKTGEGKFWIYAGTQGGAGFMVSPGTMTAVTNNEFTGPYQGFGNGITLPNGTSLETGAVDVTVNSDGTLTGSFTSDDAGTAKDEVSFTTLAYDQTTYSHGSSQSDLLANGGSYGFQFNLPGTGTVSGTFVMGAGGDSKTITITGVDLHTCTYSGSATVINSKYDAYDVVLTRSCGGSALALSGIGVFYPAGVIAPSNTFGMLLDDGATVGVEIVAQ